MPYYRLYGKQYHREHSDYFAEVVKASSPLAAINKLAKELNGFEHLSEVTWYREKPKLLKEGQQDSEPSFWVGDDEIYKVRSITKVKPTAIICPECNGIGKTKGYVAVGSLH